MAWANAPINGFGRSLFPRMALDFSCPTSRLFANSFELRHRFVAHFCLSAFKTDTLLLLVCGSLSEIVSGRRILSNARRLEVLWSTRKAPLIPNMHQYRPIYEPISCSQDLCRPLKISCELKRFLKRIRVKYEQQFIVHLAQSINFASKSHFYIVLCAPSRCLLWPGSARSHSCSRKVFLSSYNREEADGVSTHRAAAYPRSWQIRSKAFYQLLTQWDTSDSHNPCDRILDIACTCTQPRTPDSHER